MKNLERADAEIFNLKLPRHNQQPPITTTFKTYLIPTTSNTEV